MLRRKGLTSSWRPEGSWRLLPPSCFCPHPLLALSPSAASPLLTTLRGCRVWVVPLTASIYPGAYWRGCHEHSPKFLGFPGGSEGKESACNAGDLGSIHGLGRSPGEGYGYPLQYSGLENSIDRGAWQTTVHAVAKSWT